MIDGKESSACSEEDSNNFKVKMKSIAIVALLLACAFAKNHDEDVTQINEMIHYGAQGFESGLYKKDVQVSDECAGDWSVEVVNEMLTALDQLSKDFNTNIMIVAGDIAQLAVKNYNYCGIDTTLNDLYDFCVTKGKCGIQRLTINVTINSGKIMTAFNDILTALQTKPTTDEEFVQQISTISENSGEILQLVTAFKG